MRNDVIIEMDCRLMQVVHRLLVSVFRTSWFGCDVVIICIKEMSQKTLYSSFYKAYKGGIEGWRIYNYPNPERFISNLLHLTLGLNIYPNLSSAEAERRAGVIPSK